MTFETDLEGRMNTGAASSRHSTAGIIQRAEAWMVSPKMTDKESRISLASRQDCYALQSGRSLAPSFALWSILFCTVSRRSSDHRQCTAMRRAANLLLRSPAMQRSALPSQQAA